MMNQSRYNLFYKLKSGKYLVFNTFVCSLSIISAEEYINFNESNNQEYIDNGFFTKDDELKYIIDNHNEILKDNTYAHYTIFTTSLCNAHCKYCFENEFDKMNMDMATAKKVVKKICNKDNSKKRIHIQWFGGEPLLNLEVFDYISNEVIKYANANNIKYTANIVTNGTLLNDEIIEYLKMHNIVNIQITLDGTKKIYEEIKNYKNIKDAYDLVLSNIEKCLKNNFDLSVRINFDKNNFQNILELLSELSKFNNYSNFRVYAMPIYETSITNDNSVIKEDEINEYFEKIFNMMIDLKLIKSTKYFNLIPTSVYCKAYKDNTKVFFPDGLEAKCTHTREKLNNKVSKKCLECIFLPMCGGGCLVNENGCSSSCYIYKSAFKAVLNSILTISNINDTIL